MMRSDRLPKLKYTAAHVKQMLHDKLIEHKQYINEHDKDMPEIFNWQWGYYRNLEKTTSPKTDASSSSTPSQEGGEGVAKSSA